MLQGQDVMLPILVSQAWHVESLLLTVAPAPTLLCHRWDALFSAQGITLKSKPIKNTSKHSGPP